MDEGTVAILVARNSSGTLDSMGKYYGGPSNQRGLLCSYEKLIQSKNSQHELLKGENKKMANKTGGIRTEQSETNEMKALLQNRKTELTELRNLRYLLQQEIKKNGNTVHIPENFQSVLRQNKEQISKAVGVERPETSPRTMCMELNDIKNVLKQWQEIKSQHTEVAHSSKKMQNHRQKFKKHLKLSKKKVNENEEFTSYKDLETRELALDITMLRDERAPHAPRPGLQRRWATRGTVSGGGCGGGGRRCAGAVSGGGGRRRCAGAVSSGGEGRRCAGAVSRGSGGSGGRPCTGAVSGDRGPSARDPRRGARAGMACGAPGSAMRRALRCCWGNAGQPGGADSPRSLAHYKAVTKWHRAASAGDAARVRKMLVRGKADVNAADRHDRTALHFACAYGHPKVVTLLLRSGCEVDAVDSDCNTALMKATQCQQEDCVCILLEHGANPNRRDACGKTALQHAVSVGNIRIAAKLVAFGAYVDNIRKDILLEISNAAKEDEQHMSNTSLKNEEDEGKVDDMENKCRGQEESNEETTASHENVPEEEHTKKLHVKTQLETDMIPPDMELNGSEVNVSEDEALAITTPEKECEHQKTETTLKNEENEGEVDDMENKCRGKEESNEETTASHENVPEEEHTNKLHVKTQLETDMTPPDMELNGSKVNVSEDENVHIQSSKCEQLSKEMGVLKEELRLMRSAYESQTEEFAKLTHKLYRAKLQTKRYKEISKVEQCKTFVTPYMYCLCYKSLLIQHFISLLFDGMF
ncbi:POTE ankyrin domain family member B-like [Perognathus longimembris pacificus]|uniref:POTE ankyrin domain family member B-like n=1 Tax=Perognathus longimembris pacificus TaxID=214514 RepID=UPI0020193D7C|nr:POTE ankyrin domain family member B-like [Perognathus longimembris pacificus]